MTAQEPTAPSWSPAFDTPIVRSGPPRQPRRLLGEQTYGGHASVHDDETAASLGLTGAPIEGPTYISQFDPLAYSLWGRRWFETAASVPTSDRW